MGLGDDIDTVNALHRLDPSRHLAAAIGWAVFGVVVAAALVTALLVSQDAERRARIDTQEGLAEFATQVRDALSMHMQTRRALLEATAAQIGATGAAAGPAVQRDLQSLRQRFPEFAWLGLVDGRGGVQDSVGSLSGDDVQALVRSLEASGEDSAVSDLRARAAQAPGSIGKVSRVVEIAVRLTPRDHGRPRILVGQLSWNWVEGLLGRMRDALDPQSPLELLVASRDGAVLAGPPGWPGRTLRDEAQAAEGGDFVVGSRTALRLADGVGLGWTAFVREDAERALAPVRDLRRTVFFTVLLAGLLAAAAAFAVTQVHSRRLRHLAAEAEQLRRGERIALTVPDGRDEVSRIGATLAHLVEHLQQEKQALLDLNRDLDARVAQRTSRIERMAEETRHAAVTRERLRIARDLHDTLAQSLMALLTQIRLVRKLRHRMDGDELDAELGRAEEVAGSGLANARSVIGQIRDSGVRDTGLGPALEGLVRHFGQRSGVDVRLRTDAVAAACADERAEAVYRIVEEALRNVERHAGAQTVEVDLGASPGHAAAGAEIAVAVCDDGVGFDPGQRSPGHFGLTGMRELATLVSGELEIRSAPGAGTRVRLKVPAAD